MPKYKKFFYDCNFVFLFTWGLFDFNFAKNKELARLDALEYEHREDWNKSKNPIGNPKRLPLRAARLDPFC